MFVVVLSLLSLTFGLCNFLHFMGVKKAPFVVVKGACVVAKSRLNIRF